LIAASLALAGCTSGSTATSPPVPPNISGDYTGTFQDTLDGSGTASATFAQTGTSAGGTITVATSSATLSAQTSLTLVASNSFTGAIVIDYPSGTQCTFSTNGTYNPNTNVVSGSLNAVTNCTGATGSYTLTQQCSATATSAEERTTLGFPVRC
jgi:hypothetical protein